MVKNKTIPEVPRGSCPFVSLFLTGVKIDDDLGEWKTALTH